MQPIPYLGFNGKCAEAMRSCEAALGGKLEILMSGADSPIAAEILTQFAHRILHARLALKEGGCLSGGDAPTHVVSAGIHGASVTLNFATAEEANPDFDRLSPGRQSEHGDGAILLGQELRHAHRSVRHPLDRQLGPADLVDC